MRCLGSGAASWWFGMLASRFGVFVNIYGEWASRNVFLISTRAARSYRNLDLRFGRCCANHSLNELPLRVISLSPPAQIYSHLPLDANHSHPGSPFGRESRLARLRAAVISSISSKCGMSLLDCDQSSRLARVIEV